MRRTKVKKRKIIRRRKKSIFTNFYFSFSVFASIIIFSTIGFFLFSPRFQVQELNVSGNKDIPTDQLKQMAEEGMKTSFSFMGFDISTASIFLSGNKGVNSLMEAFPEIEKVSVKKNFPNGLSLEIIEKTPFSIWTDVFDNSKCYLVDSKGSYIKEYNNEEEYSSLIKVIQKEKIKDLDKKVVLEKLSLIKKELGDSSINVFSFDLYEEKVLVKSDVGCSIIFDINKDLDWQIEKLSIVLQKSKYSSDLSKLEYIELRFGNNAYIK
jgi:cell division septal protein FtsQ